MNNLVFGMQIFSLKPCVLNSVNDAKGLVLAKEYKSGLFVIYVSEGSSRFSNIEICFSLVQFPPFITLCCLFVITGVFPFGLSEILLRFA